MAPALCAPARVARAMASDFHANLNVAAGVVTGTLTACGSMPLAVWGALPKRRGNAGSDSELPYHLNTFLEARWDCVFASTLSHSTSRSRTRSRTHTHSLNSLSLSVQLVRVFLRTRARAFPALLPLSRSLPFFSLLFFVIVFACSSSLSYLLPLCTSFLFFFTSASSSCCFFFLVVVFFSFVSALANPCWLKPLWLLAQLLGGVDVGSRTKDLSSNVALCCVVLRRWEWSSPAFQFHDVLSFQL